MPRVNLVPIEEQKRESRRRFYIVPFAGAAVLLIAMGASYVYFDRQVADTERELQEYTQANESQAPQVMELDKYESIQIEKQSRLTSVIGLYSQRVRWSRILDDLAFVIPEDIWLDSISGNVPGQVIKPTTAGGAESENDFVIDGFTDDMQTVAVLMVRLTLIPSLTNITLVSAEKEQVESGDLAIHFVVGADLTGVGDVTTPSIAPTTGEEGPSETTTTNTGTSTGTRTTGTTTGGGNTTGRTGTAGTSTTGGGTTSTTFDDEA